MWTLNKRDTDIQTDRKVMQIEVCRGMRDKRPLLLCYTTGIKINRFDQCFGEIEP